MFLESRIYRGASGRVYPLPFYDSIAGQPIAHAWDAVYLENEFFRVMLLPQLGGRIHRPSTFMACASNSRRRRRTCPPRCSRCGATPRQTSHESKDLDREAPD